MPKVYDTSGKAVQEIELPRVFGTAYRPDIIRRAVLAEQSAKRQPYGADPLAGKRTSAHYHGKRKYRWAMMNREMSRMARIHGKVGYLSYTARFVPQAVKGRKAHPPKAEKIWLEKINSKEKTLAIKSALAASADMGLVEARGHKTQESPIIFIDDIEGIKKTGEAVKVLASLLPHELERCAVRKIRAGRGKMRGRRYRKRKGPLIIVSKTCSLMKAAGNIPGVDVAAAGQLDAEMLAPGTHAGRLLILTKGAVGKLGEMYGD